MSTLGCLAVAQTATIEGNAERGLWKAARVAASSVSQLDSRAAASKIAASALRRLKRRGFHPCELIGARLEASAKPYSAFQAPRAPRPRRRLKYHSHVRCSERTGNSRWLQSATHTPNASLCNAAASRCRRRSFTHGEAQTGTLAESYRSVTKTMAPILSMPCLARKASTNGRR
jgi:hypothetical protein